MHLKRLILLIVGLHLVLVFTACSGLMQKSRVPTETIPPTHTAVIPTLAFTPLPSATPGIVYPTIQAPQTPTTDIQYQPGPYVNNGAYRIQLWTRESGDFFVLGNILTISAVGKQQIQRNFVTDQEIHLEDVTGDGAAELIVSEYSGGAHCCFTTAVYQFTPDLHQILDSYPSNCSGRFEDLGGDGVPEFLTCDDRWAYRYCPFAASPLPLVILEYEDGKGYVDASLNYPDQYAGWLENGQRLAETASVNQDSFDGTSKCAVLPLVLGYLYQNQTDDAWNALEKYYTYPDKSEFRADVEATFSEELYPR